MDSFDDQKADLRREFDETACEIVRRNHWRWALVISIPALVFAFLCPTNATTWTGMFTDYAVQGFTLLSLFFWMNCHGRIVIVEPGTIILERIWSRLLRIFLSIPIPLLILLIAILYLPPKGNKLISPIWLVALMAIVGGLFLIQACMFYLVKVTGIRMRYTQFRFWYERFDILSKFGIQDWEFYCESGEVVTSIKTSNSLFLGKIRAPGR